MKPVIEIVLQAVQLEQSIKDAALVITGEGRIDSQTVGGKAPIGVASVGMQHNVPRYWYRWGAGEGVGWFHDHGIDAVFNILPRLSSVSRSAGKRRNQSLSLCA